MLSRLKFLFLFNLFLICSSLQSQNLSILDKFHVFGEEGKVYITCTIRSGNTCNGIKVLRSTDSLNYDLIGMIDGVCGSSSEPITYNFIDLNPIVNQKLYYKLELGGYGFTSSVSYTLFEAYGNGYLIKPNPAFGITNIYIDNKLFSQYKILVYNNTGAKVFEQLSDSGFFTFNAADLPKGIFYFVIQSDGQEVSISGKFIIP
ncbi:MAG: T9SS type A sorting domain-containing protein [Bacteroidia bacterium]|nr:T9SS type A sorting domain-containing protein [Bacteroidia bacterium]